MRILLGVLGIIVVSGSLMAQTLNTPHYKIVITCKDTQYEVDCDKASYQATNKATGATINLMGKQLMHKCADGDTSCHSLGYQFTNGKIMYFVSEGGQFNVIDGARVLIDESGEWTY